jgi:hypothetical protein
VSISEARSRRVALPGWLGDVRGAVAANSRPTQRLHNPAVMGCRYDQLPIPTSSFEIFQSWDTASKDGGQNDYSVCTTWLLNEGKYYLKHVLRDRFDYPTLKARAIANAREYRTNRILVEDTGVGTALIPELLQAGFSAIGVKPHHDKKRAWQSNPQNSRVEAFFSRAGRHGLRIWRPSCSVFRLHVMMTGSTASARPWRMKSHMAGRKIT